MADDTLALASEFPAADREAWEALAGDVDRLRSTTYDGLTIEPLYTAADRAPDPGLPGFAPFVRGHSPAGTRGGWDVRQIVRPQDGPGLARSELENGATSLLVQLRRVERIDAAVLDAALDGVYLDVAAVVLDAGPRWRQAADALTALWEQRGLPSEAVTGGFGADPFGEWVSDRSIDLDALLTATVVWAKRAAASWPGVRTITIDGGRFHDAGASDAQELGFVAASAVETLRALVDSGLDVDEGFAQIELRLVATADQFATIAKFRAARRVWARVAEIAGEAVLAARTPLHAATSRAMMTRYDASVNMLRGTVACFAAGVAGADAVTVRSFDECSAPSNSALGRRIARNTQSVLAMESHVADVIDPAGGSWYVERLTADVAEAAWAVFQDVEQAGGFRAAVEAGAIHDRIADVQSRREADINTRKAPITGVTEFPNVAEPVPAVVRSSSPPDGEDLASENLQGQRWVEHIENLRSRVDAAASAGARPAVFLATVGPPATFTARAMFAKNHFGVAGIEARVGPVSSDPAEIAAAFAADDATVACICSADDTYADSGVDVARELAAAGAARVYLAGEPTQLIDSLVAAGVTHTISAGDDVYATLSDLVEFLGVA